MLTDKRIEDVRIVINGGGAAGIRIGELFREAGAQHIMMCDSRGVIHDGRDNLNPQKLQFAVKTDCRCLEDAVKGADVFIGVSKPNLLTGDMVKSMADKPAVFAMSNPVPEIMPEEAREARPDAYIATGRSDYPNQINNVLGFPFIFRGALDVRARDITTAMKLACSDALADLARREVPDYIRRVYRGAELTFGREYMIPKPFDKRVFVEASSAVAEAAMKDGVARMTIDIDKYRADLTKKIETMLSE